MSQGPSTGHHDEFPNEMRARESAHAPELSSGPAIDQLFRSAVEQSPDAIVVVDRDGHIQLWNAAAESVFGFSKDEALGKRVDVIVPDHLRAAHWQGFHRAMASGRTKYERHPLTTLARHKSDSPRYVELTFSILKHEREVIGAMAIARDVTARHMAESSLRQQAIELAFISLDLDWRVTFLNRAAQSLLGADALGKNLWEAFPAVIGTQLYDDFYRSAADQQPLHHESFVPAFGGWVEVHAYPSPVGLGVYLRNINERKRLEKELSLSEERLRLFVQRVYDYAIVFCDVDGRVTSWNVGAERMYRYSAEEIVGKHYSVLFPEEDVRAGRPEAILAQARASGRCEEEAWSARKDGTRFWVDAIVTPLIDADGQFHGFSVVTRDMTERKAAEEALHKGAARVRRLVESNIVAVNVEDGAGHVLDANDAFLRLLGYTREDLRSGRIDCSRIVAPEQLDAHLSAMEEARRTGIAPIRERQYVRRNGSRVHALIGRASLEEDDRFVTFILDISDRKQLEMERARLLKESEAAVAARDEFLSIATHELRTPLTSLNLQLQLLERAARKGLGREPAEAEATDVSPSTQLRLIESCERQTRRLADLLNELLDLTRIRLGRLQLATESIDLVRIAREVVERLMPSAKRAGSSVAIHGDAAVVGRWDPLRLEQVVTNLVSNAIKYGQGRPIDVSVAARRGRGVAELSVRDQGMGIAPEMHARIFDRFERAYEGRAIAGLGLGLYIVRQIVQAHGGSVHVESDLGKGSTFTVELPLGS